MIIETTEIIRTITEVNDEETLLLMGNIDGIDLLVGGRHIATLHPPLDGTGVYDVSEGIAFRMGDKEVSAEALLS